MQRRRAAAALQLQHCPTASCGDDVIAAAAQEFLSMLDAPAPPDAAPPPSATAGAPAEAHDAHPQDT